MLVRFLGFQFSIEKAQLTLEEHVAYLQKHGDTSFKFSGHDRYIHVNSTHSDKYYVGLLVTVKDQKKYCELVKERSGLFVKVSDVAANASPMDFNFFVINKKTGQGMYQHYHQSCSVNSFGYMNKVRFSDLLSEQRDLALAAGKAKGVSKKEMSRILKKYSGRLNYEILVRKEKLLELIKELDCVKAFEYSVYSFDVSEPELKPLNGFVKKVGKRFSFNKKTPVGQLAPAIVSVIDALKFHSGKIVGEDEDGLERILRIVDNPDNFGEYEFDDVASKIDELNVEEFQNSWVIAELLNKCDQNKHIYEAVAI